MAASRPAQPVRFRPDPVLCDDEAAWFSNSEGQPVNVRVQSYIRERFAGLLTEDDIARLEGNDVMMSIVAEHLEQFDAPAEQQQAGHKVA